MLIPTLIMAVFAVALFVIATVKGDGANIAGLKSATRTLLEILPLLIFAFIIGGLVQVLLPRDLLSSWVGTESGFRGIMIGTLAGSVTPGGPYVSYPIAAALMKSGAGIGTMVAFVTGWSLWAVARLPMEVGILGWRFTIIRLISVVVFPPIAGVVANGVARIFHQP